MLWPKLRVSEWVLAGFFAYIVIISPFFPSRPNLGIQPLLILAAVLASLLSVAYLEKGRLARAIGIFRDFLPLGMTLAAFREMELFLPLHYDYRFEELWIRWDRLLLDSWHLRALIELTGKAFPFYLELSYLLVYGLPFYCLGTIYIWGDRKLCDRFLIIYLTGTLTAYALFPYFPSQPPRIAFPQVDFPGVTTFIRRFNLSILHAATIHVGVFPSAHVSSAFSAAWGMFVVLPRRKWAGWALVFYAISVSLATIYGRYHYAADVLGGFAVSLFAGVIALLLKNTRKTGPVSSASPEGLASSSSVWRRASAPFALLKNTRKTGPVSSAPSENLASSSSVWRRASAPFALLRPSTNAKPGSKSDSPDRVSY